VKQDINKIVYFFFLFSCNNFNISDGDMRPIGIGLYPVAALINHSCVPNSVAVFEGTTVSIRAIQPIAPDEEVTISYIEIGASNSQRQTMLRDHFFFVCQCPRCAVESPEAIGLRCSKKGCEGVAVEGDSANSVCLVCGTRADQSDISNSLILGRQASKQAEEATDPVVKRRYLEQAAGKFMEILHPHNVELLHALDAAMNACIDLQDFEAANHYCKLSLPVYEHVYPSNWPLLGLQYFIKGKMDWYLQHTKNALVWLRKALKVLQITHGMQHTMVKELLLLLQEAQAEAEHMEMRTSD